MLDCNAAVLKKQAALPSAGGKHQVSSHTLQDKYQQRAVLACQQRQFFAAGEDGCLRGGKRPGPVAPGNADGTGSRGKDAPEPGCGGKRKNTPCLRVQGRCFTNA